MPYDHHSHHTRHIGERTMPIVTQNGKNYAADGTRVSDDLKKLRKQGYTITENFIADKLRQQMRADLDAEIKEMEIKSRQKFEQKRAELMQRERELQDRVADGLLTDEDLEPGDTAQDLLADEDLEPGDEDPESEDDVNVNDLAEEKAGKTKSGRSKAK